jgi:single-stranded DNA-specific DHH superfamily exonuclease
MLTTKEIEEIRDNIDNSKNPLFFYDDDPDGVCSFLLLYKIKKEGKGVIIKSSPKMGSQWLRKVDEINPDKIFILDKPILDQEFIDGAKRDIIYIDHHQVQELKNLKYYNPRLKKSDAYYPTTYMAYQVNGNPENLWLGMVGCLGDWMMPEFAKDFSKQYPELLPKVKDLKDAVYKQPIGKLVRIVSFILKGPTSEVRKSIKILSRIETPLEILNQETPQGKYLFKRFSQINLKYLELITDAKKKATSSKLLLYYYSENKWSFTADLANELTNTYENKVILIARKKNGEMKCSVRGQKPIRGALEKALVGIEGYGGGHENACGTVIKEDYWDQFLVNFKREIKKI